MNATTASIDLHTDLEYVFALAPANLEPHEQKLLELLNPLELRVELAPSGLIRSTVHGDLASVTALLAFVRDCDELV